MKKLDGYKKQIIKAGFSVAKFEPYRFFRTETEKTAFIVNLTKTENGIEVLYGFCTTSFDPEYKDHFEKWGKNKENCNLRRYITIESNEDATKVRDLIHNFYAQYHNAGKDELLNITKELRKAFLHRFVELLKPIGFRKKGNKWTKKFAEDFILEFYAQKSDYSDQYYFNVSIDKEGSNNFMGCYYTRINTNSEGIYNWQLMSEAEIAEVLNVTERMINTILNTSIEALGKQKWIWEHCMCRRDLCESCWVAKNMWEAKESDN